jgi:hypothetical protein
VGVEQYSNFTKYFGRYFLEEGNCIDNPFDSLDAVNQYLPKITQTYRSSQGNGTFTLTLNPLGSIVYPQYCASSDSGPYYYQLCPGITDGGVSASGFSVFGHTAISQFVTIYDQGNNQVGFVPSTACPQPALATPTGR